MTTILFDLVLLALALDLIIWGIDQGWSCMRASRTSTTGSGYVAGVARYSGFRRLDSIRTESSNMGTACISAPRAASANIWRRRRKND